MWFTFLLMSTLAQASLEEMLKSALRPVSYECPPAEVSHCEDFHQAGCKQSDFQKDGTGEVRTMAAWDSRVKQGKERVLPGLSLALQKKYRELQPQEWVNVAKSVLGSDECQSHPANDVCLQKVAKIQGANLLDAAMTPVKDSGSSKPEIPMGPFRLQGILSDEEMAPHLNLLLNEIRFKEDEEKMIQMVGDIKELIKNKISSDVSDPLVRDELLRKIDNTSFKGFTCGDNDHLKSYSVDGAFNTIVQGNKREITYCAGNFRTNSSSFNLAYLLAHEFAHSVDPCGYRPKDMSVNKREFLERQHPYANVLSCLRSPDSVGAEWSEEFYKNDLPNMSLCMQDQIGESFSDWMAAEVVPQFISKKYPGLGQEDWKQGFLNVSRTLDCEARIIDPFESNVSAHPQPKRRINKIMMGSSQIRQLVGCEKSDTIVQCSQTTDASKLTKPLPKGPVPFRPVSSSMLSDYNQKSNKHDACFVKH